MKIKAPQILTDLYRDLRDRHLLLPAIVLLVALIAVPIVLREPAADVPPVAAAQPPSSDATAITSAVLVDDSVNVRQYQKRLAALKEKNPFESNFALPGAGGGGGADEAADAAAGGEAPATSSASTDTVETGTVPPSTPGTDTGTPAGDTGGSTDPDSDTDTPAEPVQPEIRFFAGRVDVTIGPIGDAKDYDNVKYLNFLPDDKAPLVAFIGLAGTGDSAVFAISSDVEMGEGDGSCAPKKPDPCQFLTLKPGEQRYLKYDGTAYRLKLRNTHVVQIPDPRDSADETADEGETSDSGYDPSDDAE